MSELRNKVISEYIRDHYPDARIVEYDEPDSGLSYYTSDELQNVDSEWFPLCSFKNAAGKVVYGGRGGIHHTYTEGETGIGKTTRFVMQSIRALSSMKTKPSFLVVDLHGEIVENLHDHLTANGYDIKILNCDDPSMSDSYNPFAQSVKDCLEAGRITDSTMALIKRICEIINPVEDEKDPSWERGAAAYTNGLILDKFEELIKGNIPPECINLYNILQTHFWLRKKMGAQGGRSTRDAKNIFDIPYYKNKPEDSLSVQKMLAVTNCAESTQVSYFSVAETQYDIFNQPLFYQLSSDSTISITDFIEKPTVIVIQSGNSKIGETLVSLLVNDIYSTVVKMGKKNVTKRVKRNIQCFLDEFANCNIADKDEFTKMLTTSRKFGMFWHMMLQCDAQLERKFDPETGKIIRSNCTEIFMGSNDYDTQVRFARSCGKKTIESLASSLTNQAPTLETVDVIIPEKLHLTEVGYAYVKSNKHHIMRTFIEAFYNCPEFTRPDDISTVYPENSFDYTKTKFLPDDSIDHITNPEFEVLSYIYHTNTNINRVTLDELKAKFKGYQMEKILAALQRKGVLDKNFVDRYFTTVSPAQFYLLEYRYKNSISSPELSDADIESYFIDDDELECNDDDDYVSLDDDSFILFDDDNDESEGGSELPFDSSAESRMSDEDIEEMSTTITKFLDELRAADQIGNNDEDDDLDDLWDDDRDEDGSEDDSDSPEYPSSHRKDDHPFIVPTIGGPGASLPHNWITAMNDSIDIMDIDNDEDPAVELDIGVAENGFQEPDPRLQALKRAIEERTQRDTETNDSDSDEESSIDPEIFVARFKKNLAHYNVSVTTEQLDEITCVPKIIKSAILHYTGHETELDEEEFKNAYFEFIIRSIFRITRCYVANNDYPDIETWKNEFEKQYELILKYNLFPRNVISRIHSAVNSFKKHMKFDGIARIKEDISEEDT